MIDPRPGGGRRLGEALRASGHRVVCLAGWEAARAEGGAPAVVLMGGGAGVDFQALSRRIRRRWPQVDILRVAARPEELPPGGTARGDVLIPPASPALWPALLEGARRQARLRRRRQRLALRRARQWRERLDTARFLAVKQIVDKLSDFIGQLARDVEGGVRYVDEMPYFVAIHDRRGRLLAANRAYRVLLGRRVGDACGAIYEGPSGTVEESPVGRTLRTAEAQVSREIVRYRSGARVPAIVHTAPIYGDEGEVELVLEVFAGAHDVAERRREMAALQQRYQLIFENVPCGVAVLDRELRVVANNRAIVDAFGDKTGLPFGEAFGLDDETLAASPVGRTRAEGRADHGEITLRAGSGRPLAMLAWTAPIHTAAGKLVQILVILLDVTPIREMQGSLASLGLMIGSISHSIKGVLTGLDAGVYLISQGVARSDRAQIESGLDIARRAVERVRRMILDILFCAKEREPRRESVEVKRFADELYLACRRMVEGKNVRLIWDIGEEPGSFEVDPEQLASAVLNLVENAVDACAAADGGRPHTVRLQVEAGAEAVGISVEDDGIGMTPDQLKNLFTLFYSTKGGRGTGLGLYIADRIVRRHGGDIVVESTPGQGSRFCLRLPRRPPPAV